jgi:hypothetical protein
MNKLTDSSSNIENDDDDNTWKEIKQRLDNGASIRNIAFEYNDYYNVNKLKICDYFYDVLVAREEKNKNISKENNEIEVLSKKQTAEEVQKIFDELNEFYDDLEEKEIENEEILEVIFDKLKNGASSLQISKEFTEYYNANKSNIHFCENYFTNLKHKSLEKKEENNQKQKRKLKRQRDSDSENDEDDKEKKEEEENETDWLSEVEEEDNQLKKLKTPMVTKTKEEEDEEEEEEEEEEEDEEEEEEEEDEEEEEKEEKEKEKEKNEDCSPRLSRFSDKIPNFPCYYNTNNDDNNIKKI